MEKLLIKSNFSFSQCLLTVWRTFYFHQTCNYCLQTLSFSKSLKFVVLESLTFTKWQNLRLVHVGSTCRLADNKMNVTQKKKKMKFVMEKKETLWEQENMLVTSIFSFSYNFFKRPLSVGCFKLALCGKELKETYFINSVLLRQCA